nr:MAG TPA: hypothetical protein [Caudoviricetes sp.]
MFIFFVLSVLNLHFCLKFPACKHKNTPTSLKIILDKGRSM